MEKQHGLVPSLRFAALVVVMLLLAGCASQPSSGGTVTPAAEPGTGQVGKKVETAHGTYTNLSPNELKPMLDNKDFFLVDTHIPPEGRLPKTDLRVPFDEVEQQIDKFPADKDAKIVITCRSGSMSSDASQTLLKLGYTNVYNLDGGMNAWRGAGYEIVPEDK